MCLKPDMARNDTTRPRKKQKVNSAGPASQITAKETPHKARRKRISRRISSGPSASFEQTGREVQRQKVPTFYQPRSPLPNSQSTSRNLDRPTAREPGDQNEDDDGNSVDEEDYEEDEEAMLKRLEKLPTDKRYTSIGKMFTLVVWPWVSPGWWLGHEEVIEEPARNLSSVEKLAHRRKKFDAKKQREFAVFLGIQMGISSDEWMTTNFRTKVTIPCFAL